VFYELLTGRRAFEGETITETLASILKGEPDWKALPQNTPTRIRELMADCLEKGFDDRLPDIGSARIQIKRALKEPATTAPTDVAHPAHPVLWKRAIPWGMAAFVVIVVLGIAFWNSLQPELGTSTKLVITAPPNMAVTNISGNDLAISPDGRTIIYRLASGTGGDQLYLRSLDEFAERPISGTELGFHPAFSPDGEFIAFFASGQLKKVSLTGGVPTNLNVVAGSRRNPSWETQDSIVFSNGINGLQRIPATGGEPEELIVPSREQGETGYSNPQILPGGEAVLFTVYLDNGAQLAIFSLETGEKKVILSGALQATYVETGHLIYGQFGTTDLMAVPFDLESLEVVGSPVTVLQGVRRGVAYFDYAVSQNGTLVYTPGTDQGLHEHNLVWVDRQGNETLVTEEKKDYRAPRISPDGKLIAMPIGDPASNNVWTYDLEAESLSRVTFEEPRNGTSIWSPDSKWLVFQSGGVQNEGGMVRQPADRSLPQERLTSTKDYGGRQMPNSWSSDGKFIAFNEGSGKLTGTFDIGVLSMEGDGEPEYLLASDALECCPKFSPDGRWLAYVSDESGLLQVYVRPFPGPDVKWLISEEEEGGGQPVWSPDGKELFYRIGDNKTMVVSIQTQGQTLTAGSPRVLFEGRYVSHSAPTGYQYYDISPDGKRFLMLKEATGGEETQINIVLNWFEELKRLVPTN
jgi:serine/threonine-protein kinase